MKANPCVRTCRKRDEKAKEETSCHKCLSNLFNDVLGGVKLLHINIGNFRRKIEEMKDDDIFKNADIISLNETHLGHSDTLTPDMRHIGEDVLIDHCYYNNRGGQGCSYCKHKTKSQTESE